MSHKVFTHKHTVYFDETNAMGGVVYFANFVKWQGLTREAFFMHAIPNWKDIMNLVANGNAQMITVEEHSHFKRNAGFGDTVIIQLQTSNLRRCSFDLTFKMFRNSEEELIYEGWQRLTFADREGQFIEIPDFIRGFIQAYSVKNGDYLKKYAHKDKAMQEV
jgi:acyl-CoA thioesterase FadM